MRTRIGQVLLGICLLAFTACQADVTVDLDVTESGAGTVLLTTQLDADAVTTLGDVQQQLRVTDLERVGWNVVYEPGEVGGVVVSATKAVSGPSQWQATLDEIAGPGVFTNVMVTSQQEFAQQSQRVSFDVDLSKGWLLFSDDQVAAALEGEYFGAPIDTLTSGRSIDDIIGVSVSTTVSSNDQSVAAGDQTTVRFDDTEPARITVTATTEQSTAVLLRWIAIALGALAVLATILAVTGIVLQRRADRLRPAPRPASLASRVPTSRSAPVIPAAAVSDALTSDTALSVRLVVVEPLSVLYQQSQPADIYLLPFVRQNGGKVRADTILDGHASVLTGAMPTASFWELCGLAGDPQGIDATYIKMRALRPGAADFIAEMQSRRIPIAAASDDGAEWSLLSRERDRLRGIWPWLVSGEVGVTKPSLGIFEILRRESGVAYGHCLYVDTNIDNLDAAQSLGMKTALFDSGDLDLPDVVGHPVVTDFKGLFGSKK